MLEQILTKEGIITNSENNKYITEWNNWYKGFEPSFHVRTIKDTEGKSIKIRLRSIGAAKQMCEDLTKLIWAEGCDISTKSYNIDITKEIIDIINNEKNGFYKNASDFIEKVIAKGSGVLIEFIDNDEIAIDYVSADNIIPIEYVNNYVTSFAEFKQRKVKNKKEFRYHNIVSIHKYDGEIYTKENILYISKDKNSIGKKSSFNLFYDNVENPYQLLTKYPPFQFINTPITNNLTTSPLGISIFANSIDKLKSLDNKYDSFDEEFTFGKKKIMIDAAALHTEIQPDADGNPVRISYFDTNDRVFVAYKGDLNNTQPLKEIDFNLRVDEHIKAINSELNWLSASVGLGQGFYEFTSSGLKTATEVISKDNQAFRTATNYRNVIVEALENMVKAICSLKGVECTEVLVSFNDGVITDTETAKNNARVEVSQGLRSKLNYLIEYRGLSEEQAQKEIKIIEEEKARGVQDFGFDVE